MEMLQWEMLYQAELESLAVAVPYGEVGKLCCDAGTEQRPDVVGNLFQCHIEEMMYSAVKMARGNVLIYLDVLFGQREASFVFDQHEWDKWLQPAYFILNGIPGLEAAHVWVSLPFCCMYFIAVAGNGGLIYLISHEEALHRPMYYFLAMLSLTDISGCNTFVPSMLCIFWFNLKAIGFNACLVQMFFIHMLAGMESGVLMLMALDRYVAICYPLRYATILTNAVITKVGLATFARNVLIMIPFTFLIKRLPYCKGNLIHHTYCDHMSVAKLSCGNIKINVIYGLIAALLIGGFDMVCIFMSYTLIIRAVLALSSADARHKAFSTCTSHICAIIITYVPAFFNFFTHRFGEHTIPHHVHILIANLYLLLPPTLNPIIYGVKTKQIQEGVIKLFLGRKTV